jgi:hypothetical protein
VTSLVSAFIARRWRVPQTDFRVDVETLAGGLESTVARARVSQHGYSPAAVARRRCPHTCDDPLAKLPIPLTAWPREHVVRLCFMTTPDVGKLATPALERHAFNVPAMNFARPIRDLWLEGPGTAKDGGNVRGTAQRAGEKGIGSRTCCGPFEQRPHFLPSCG